EFGGVLFGCEADPPASPGAVLVAQPRVEELEIHAVVDHVQLPLVQAEPRLDLALHHVRVADHGPQAGAREQPPLRGEHVAVVGGERDAEPGRGPERRAAVGQPLRVPAVAGAVDVAARDALVRLDQVEAAAPELGAHRPRETPVSPDATDMERVAADHATGVPYPLAREQGDRDALRVERVDRPLDETLGAAVRVVALPHQRELHGAQPGARSSCRHTARTPSRTWGPCAESASGSIA